MAKVTIDNLIERLRTKFGDSPSDDELSILEDVKDSFMTSDQAEIEKRVEEVEKKWRKKYADRFLGVKEDEDEIRKKTIIENEDEEKEIKIDDLFKERRED